MQYPGDNPVFLYSTRTWTLLHRFRQLSLAGLSNALSHSSSADRSAYCRSRRSATIFILSDDVARVLTPFFVLSPMPRREVSPIRCSPAPSTSGVLV